MIESEKYVHEMEIFISETFNESLNKRILDDQVKREYLKCNTRNYTVNFSIKIAKKRTKKQYRSILKKIMKTALMA